MAKNEERDRWKNVPEWKKQLILEREKKKQQEMVDVADRIQPVSVNVMYKMSKFRSKSSQRSANALI